MSEELGPVTKAALLELESKIIDAVRNIVSNSNETLERTIKELHEQRFIHIEKEQERSFKYHDEHFTAINKMNEKSAEERQGIRNSISKEIEELRDRVDALEEHQAYCKGEGDGKEKLLTGQINKSTVFWTAAGVIVAVLLFIAGLGVSSLNYADHIPPPPAIVPSKE